LLPGDRDVYHGFPSSESTFPAAAIRMPDDLREHLQRTLGGAYTLERELGGGGMSRVFVGTETALGRDVVVKVLPSDMSGRFSIERFRREISIAARLQHPHVVPLLTAGEVDGLPYFTMPFVEGESLRARLVSHGELPVPEAVRILREVASALSYAHGHDVVHRDIKPDNVLLSGGAAMVTDFGVAKAVDAAAAGEGGGITSIGVALGTPAYMAPEQASADPSVDHRADIYAWGAMAYEVITGQPPFAGRTPQGMLAAHVAEKPEHLLRRRPSTPGALAELVMRCLEKRPADRPQSADELVRGLDAIPSTGGDGVVPVRGPGRRPAGGLVAVGAVAVVVLVASLLWYGTKRRSASAAGSAGALSLAVLPIENVGGDSAREYLADGLTGELAGDLRQTAGLQVAGDLSTFRFKHTQLPPDEIARELGVGMLLTGRLQSQGGRIRLQMQLNDGNGKLLWSNQFDRENKDAFALQDEITNAVASELRLVLSPTTVATTRAGRTESPEAHDLYLRGMFEKNKLSDQGLARAVTYFQQALEIDPDYAQAEAGMSFAYDMQADGYLPSHPLHLLAKQAAERALRSDSMLAEAQVLYGFELAAADWDVPAGLVEMKRGLELDPNSPDGLFMYGTALFLTGESDQGLEVIDRLIRVDPLSPMASLLREMALAFGGRFEEAIRQDSVTKRLDPTVVYFDAVDGFALRELGHLEESAEAYRRYQAIIGQPAFGLAMTYARMGKRAEALEVVHAMEERARTSWVSPTVLAAAYGSLGDRDRAMAELEDAFRKKDWVLRFLMNFDASYLRSLSDDPRFVALRRKVLATRWTD
jgi:eukaryotic-like serine/threonine-protein kinase